MRLKAIVVALLALGCFSFPQSELSAKLPTIELANETSSEIETRAQLLRLLRMPGMERWTFTDRVVISEESRPHSHPVLTLNTRHRDHDDRLLATYLHEQLHWYLAANPSAARAAAEDAARAFPDLPTGYPEGARDEHSNAVHLLIGWLEWRAMEQLVGAERARQVIEFWAEDHYKAVYRKVLEQPTVLAHIIQEQGLIPSHLEIPEGIQSVGKEGQGKGS